MGFLKQIFRNLDKIENKVKNLRKILVQFKKNLKKFIFFREQNTNFPAGAGEQKARFPAGAGKTSGTSLHNTICLSSITGNYLA